jgi:hypothetical protein
MSAPVRPTMRYCLNVREDMLCDGPQGHDGGCTFTPAWELCRRLDDQLIALVRYAGGTTNELWASRDAIDEALRLLPDPMNPKMPREWVDRVTSAQVILDAQISGDPGNMTLARSVLASQEKNYPDPSALLRALADAYDADRVTYGDQTALDLLISDLTEALDKLASLAEGAGDAS